MCITPGELGQGHHDSMYMLPTPSNNELKADLVCGPCRPVSGVEHADADMDLEEHVVQNPNALPPCRRTTGSPSHQGKIQPHLYAKPRLLLTCMTYRIDIKHFRITPIRYTIIDSIHACFVFGKETQPHQTRTCFVLYIKADS